MDAFLQRLGRFVVGILHGFDRLRFRGSKRQLCHVGGVLSWLGAMRILLKDFKPWAKETTFRLYERIEKSADEAGLYR